MAFSTASCVCRSPFRPKSFGACSCRRCACPICGARKARFRTTRRGPARAGPPHGSGSRAAEVAVHGDDCEGSRNAEDQWRDPPFAAGGVQRLGSRPLPSGPGREDSWRLPLSVAVHAARVRALRNPHQHRSGKPGNGHRLPSGLFDLSGETARAFRHAGPGGRHLGVERRGPERRAIPHSVPGHRSGCARRCSSTASTRFRRACAPASSTAPIACNSTTTKEAKAHTGGKHGKGGDLLYRWGNPRAYRAGAKKDQTLFNQHNADWIPDGLPGAGHVMVFDNGTGRRDGDYSSVDEIIPPVDADGNYPLLKGKSYGPSEAVWSYAAPNKTDFFSMHISGPAPAERKYPDLLRREWSYIRGLAGQEGRMAMCVHRRKRSQRAGSPIYVGRHGRLSRFRRHGKLSGKGGPWRTARRCTTAASPLRGITRRPSSLRIKRNANLIAAMGWRTRLRNPGRTDIPGLPLLGRLRGPQRKSSAANRREEVRASTRPRPRSTKLLQAKSPARSA